MVAGNQNRRNAGFREAHHAATPLTLESRSRGTVLVSVTSKNHQVDLFVDSGFHDCVKTAQEVHHPGWQPGLRVVRPKVGHINMGIGKVEKFDHDLIIIEAVTQALLENSLFKQHLIGICQGLP